MEVSSEPTSKPLWTHDSRINMGQQDSTVCKVLGIKPGDLSSLVRTSSFTLSSDFHVSVCMHTQM